MGNHQHEDERYKKFYDRPPHGEVPKDQRVKEAREGGIEPEPDASATVRKPDPSPA